MNVLVEQDDELVENVKWIEANHVNKLSNISGYALKSGALKDKAGWTTKMGERGAL